MKENGDPTDPISFDQMVGKLWETFAAEAGLNLREHLQSDRDAALFNQQKERLDRLKMEAQREVMGFIIAGGRWWTEDRENWKRPPPRVLLSRIEDTAPDKPWRALIFLDRVEVEAAIRVHRPELYAQASLNRRTANASSPGRKRGRPPGSGALPDDRSLDRMIELLDAGAVTSIAKAAERVAEEMPDIPGASHESTIKRLSRKLRKREKRV